MDVLRNGPSRAGLLFALDYMLASAGLTLHGCGSTFRRFSQLLARVLWTCLPWRARRPVARAYALTRAPSPSGVEGLGAGWGMRVCKPAGRVRNIALNCRALDSVIYLSR